MENNCIFCKIAHGDIKSYKIYEDEFTMAFLDASNDVFGHTLVIPKQHSENLVASSVTMLNHVIKTVQIVSKHFISLGYNGINVYNNCGACAGQSVMHTHFHVVPRKNEDNAKLELINEVKNEKSLEDAYSTFKIKE